MRYDEVLQGALNETRKELDSSGEPRLWAKRAAIIAGTLLNRQTSETEVSIIFAAIQMARLAEQPGNVQAAEAAIGALAVMSELHRAPQDRAKSSEFDFSRIAAGLGRKEPVRPEPVIRSVTTPPQADKKEGA